MLEEALYSYLSDILSVGTRIFPKRAPEGTVIPYVTYERVSAQRTYTHDPFPELPWVRVRVSFACVGQTALESISLGNEVVAALSSYSGDMDGVAIGKSDVVNETDLYDPQSKLYRRVVDVLIDHEELEVTSS